MRKIPLPGPCFLFPLGDRSRGSGSGGPLGRPGERQRGLWRGFHPGEGWVPAGSPSTYRLKDVFAGDLSEVGKVLIDVRSFCSMDEWKAAGM